jgi:RNA polymerase sigma-70 factor (ECF subfamily)
VKKTANERFFEQLFIEMRSKLLRYAAAKIPEKDNAEDVVEETFKTAWQKIDELAVSENPHGWLINALKLHILKHYEKRNKEHPEKREYEEVEIPTETIFDNDISFGNSLSDGEMQIIKLKSAGYNHNEISALTGFPTGTIHSKISRIKDKLRKILGDEKN